MMMMTIMMTGEGEKVEWRKFEQETKQEQPYIEP